MTAPLITVVNLNIAIGANQIVQDLSFELAPGQCVALVGESGAGKSMTGRALMGLLPSAATSSAQSFALFGQDFYAADASGGKGGPVAERRWRAIRGANIGLVSQDALVSMDPLRRVGQEVGEPLVIHAPELNRGARTQRVHELLSRVAIDMPSERARQYPHELSGGLRQRALIAAGLAAQPQVLIADEPTTALDATVAAQVLDLLGQIKRDGTALVLISHDLLAVSQLADYVLVMKDGRVVEQGAMDQVLGNPQQPYTRELVAAVPDGTPLVGAVTDDSVPDASPGRQAPPSNVVLQASNLRKVYRMPGGQQLVAVADTDLNLQKGQTLGLVGESGSGKSTIAKMLLALETPDAGRVLLHGEPWNDGSVTESQRRGRRWRMQLIPQDAYSAMNHRWTVAKIIGEFLDARQRLHNQPALSKDLSRDRVAELLAQVGLEPEYLTRKPGQLSGGQRQRVAIARALAMDPEVLICDEPVSALDVTVQDQVVRLLARLQKDLGLAMVFISHDLAVVRQLAHHIMVLKDGEVVEAGTADQVYEQPTHPYTRELLAARS